jgi:CRISPR/Cas system endoribonuclease Cas6 (RAMP superfamily)
VFSALLRRWRQLHGPAFSLETDAWLQQGGCVVTNYRLQGVPMALRNEAGSTSFHIGWTGWVDYTADKQQKAYAPMLRALARLACFTGTGLHTEYGLGVTRLVEKG